MGCGGVCVMFASLNNVTVMSFARVHDSPYMLWKITTHILAHSHDGAARAACVCMQTRRAQLICKVLPGARGPLFMLFYAKITARAQCHAWHTAAHAKLMLLFYAISGDKFNYSPGLCARDSIWPDTLLNLLLYMWTHVNLYIQHLPNASGIICCSSVMPIRAWIFADLFF
jgi:hypothetical protein